MLGTTEQSILSRLAARLAEGTVLVGTFDDVDLTDDGQGPVIAQLRLERIDPAASVRGTAAQLLMIYSVIVYCDVHRADADDKAAAMQILQDAGDAIVGWEYKSMSFSDMVEGPTTVYDGRTLRVGFAFAVHGYFTGA